MEHIRNAVQILRGIATVDTLEEARELAQDAEERLAKVLRVVRWLAR